MAYNLNPIILKNVTDSDILIADLSGVRVTASGQIDVTELFPLKRMADSLDLNNYITNSGIVLNVDGYDLQIGNAQTYLNHKDATHILGQKIEPEIGGGPVIVNAEAYDNKYIKFSHGNGFSLQDVSFLGLDDTPDLYTGYENYIVHVNSTATGLDFTDFGEYNRQFGNNFIYELDPTESSTSSTTFIEKLTLSRTVPTGVYRVGWYFEWDVSSESAIFYARVQINDVDDIGTLASTAAAAQTSWSMTSGFHYLTMVSGTLQIDLDYRCEVKNKTAYIRNARLEFWRTE